MILKVHTAPTPNMSVGAAVPPPAGTFTADMDTLTADDTTHTADEN